MLFLNNKKQKNNTWNRKKELASVDMLIGWLKNPILKEQTKCYFLWSINKAWKYLCFYNTSNIMLIVLPATIPLIVGLRHKIPWWEEIITIVSFLSAILASSALALKYKSLWQLFRVSTERLKEECLKGSIGIDEYAGLDNEIKEKKFCENIEKIHAEALKLWKESYSD